MSWNSHQTDKETKGIGRVKKKRGEKCEAFARGREEKEEQRRRSLRAQRPAKRYGGSGQRLRRTKKALLGGVGLGLGVVVLGHNRL